MPKRLAIACLLAAQVGCGKGPEAEGPTTASTNTPAGASGESDSAASQARVAASLQEMTQAVRKYAAEQRRVPKNLEELVAGGYLSRIPQAPAGQRFAIDKNLQVYVTSP